MTTTLITQAIEKVDVRCKNGCVPSTDGKRYLVVTDDEGDDCKCRLGEECKEPLHHLVREVAKVAQERMREQTIQQCINEAGISEIAAAMIGGKEAEAVASRVDVANSIKKRIAALPLEEI